MLLRLRWPSGASPAAVVPGVGLQGEPLQLEPATGQLLRAARESCDELLARLNTSVEGLSDLQAELRLAKVGANQIAHEQPISWVVQLLKTFRNPLVFLLAALAVLSLATGDIKAAVIITAMILFSVLLRFSQEYRSLVAAESLRLLVHTTATVKRHDARKDISVALAADLGLQLSAETPGQREEPIDRLVPGDLVLLAAGDMIPADVRVLSAKDLFVS